MKSRVIHIGVIGMMIFAVMLAAGFCISQNSYGETAKPQTATTAADPGDPPTGGTGWSSDRNYYYVSWTKVSGFRTLEGKLYYFDPSNGNKKKTSGYMTRDGKLYQFASTGIAGLYTGPQDKYYYEAGVKASGFKRINGKLYYFDKTTKQRKTSGYLRYKGRLHKVSSKGAATAYSGVYKSYYHKKGLKQTKYRKTIKKMNNRKIYYFTSTGRVSKSTGWHTFKGQKYYFKKGVGCKGWSFVGSYKYYFSGNGILCKDLIKRFGSKWKKKNLLIKVNRTRNTVTLYAKSKKGGYIIPVKAFVCSVGKAKTPTIKGSYYVNRARTYRWGLLGGPTMGGYCYGQYCSRIAGGYLFHSINYTKPNKYTMSSTAYNNLGSAASHGCVRLQTINAKLIYDIARYRKTTVVIYDSKSPGALGKPTIGKVRAGQNYDPTDPNI